MIFYITFVNMSDDNMMSLFSQLINWWMHSDDFQVVDLYYLIYLDREISNLFKNKIFYYFDLDHNR